MKLCHAAGWMLAGVLLGNCGRQGDSDGKSDGGGVAEGRFSFFVASFEAMQRLSGSPDGFGGDLGGLVGADSICQRIASTVGAGSKTWRAFLSATQGGDGGGPVHAIDRIGQGPWYDRRGRLIASGLAGLLGDRPDGDLQAVNDLANELGQAQKVFGNNHDVLTGSNRMGRLANDDPASTCRDWTSADPTAGNKSIMCGHSWPRSATNGRDWLAEHAVPGCAAGANLSAGVGEGSGGACVGCAGGYGAIYCFALTP